MTNLSGLTFTSWGPEDIVKIDGTFGIDTITGSSRNDVIWGDNGGDILNGGLGADRFVYGNADHTRNATADTITGLSTAQGDRIDLRPWAASAGLPFVITGNNGTDPFTFLGSEVRWEHIGSDVHIFITEDGADVATIKLAGLSTITLGTALIL